MKEEAHALEMAGEEVVIGRGLYVTNDLVGRFQFLFYSRILLDITVYVLTENPVCGNARRESDNERNHETVEQGVGNQIRLHDPFYLYSCA